MKQLILIFACISIFGRVLNDTDLPIFIVNCVSGCSLLRFFRVLTRDFWEANVDFTILLTFASTPTFWR